MSDYEIGDVLVPADGKPLTSGFHNYYSAVVVQSEPLVLVSEDGNMRWQQSVKNKLFRIVDKVDEDTFFRCLNLL